MPTHRRSSILPAAPAELWEIVGDPFHLPRWWPGVQRVEGFDGTQFTQVMSTQKGKAVRADFTLTANEEGHRIAWDQQLEGTPFEKILKESSTAIRLEPQDDGTTKVELEISQQLRGGARMGALQMRKTAKTRLDDALEGLQALVGPG